MSSLQQALAFLVQSLFQLYIIIVLLRFMLQVAKADFYNPISQFIVKATAPPLKPLRRIIPGFAGIDIASIILALTLQLIMIVLIIIIAQARINPLLLLSGTIAGVIHTACNIYLISIFAMVISSFIPAMQRHPVVILIWQLTEPLMAPFRKLIPPMGGLDISPIFALLIIQVIQILIKPLLLV